MPSIQSIGTALPSHHYTVDQIDEIGGRWLQNDPARLDLFRRFLRSSKTDGRHFALSGDQMLQLNGMQKRNLLFEEHGPTLGIAALQDALARADLAAKDISTLLFTSCSCPSIPAIDALIIERAGLPRTTRRVPVYQYGCAGGVAGLRLAADLSRNGSPVAMSSVELCSLVFQPSNPTPAQLVGSAIFADGAATAIVTPHENGLVIRAHQSFLLPNSRHLMGYDILDDGFHLRLDRELPQALAQQAPEIVRDFLARYGLKESDIQHWLFHPGGQKILDFLNDTFALRPEQARWSRQILESVGNLSSATVLFVLNAFLQDAVCAPGDRALMLGIGPGLTVELILFEWVV